MSQIGTKVTASSMGAVITLTGNSGGPVSPDGGGNINVVGSGIITTVGTPNTLTIDLTGSVAQQFDADSGSAVPALGILNVKGGALGLATINITTVASGNTVDVDLKDDVTLLGFLLAFGNVITGSNFNMPATTADGLHGIFIHNGHRFIHSFGTNNTYMGDTVSNLTGAGSENVGIGAGVMQSFGGSGSTAVGFSAMGTSSSAAAHSVAIGSEAMSNSNGSHAVAIGEQALDSAAGNYNIGIGFQAGQTITGSSNILISNAGAAESNTIRIGTTGAGNGQQNRAFIAGISGVNVGSVATVVSISGDQLGSTTITAGSGISVTPAANSITIASTGGGLAWVNVAGTSQSMAVNTGYIANNAGLVTFTLPVTAAQGSIIRVAGQGAGGWTITENTGQSINFGSLPTTITTGSLSSTNRFDVVELLCTVANTTFNVLSAQGNLTVV